MADTERRRLLALRRRIKAKLRDGVPIYSAALYGIAQSVINWAITDRAVDPVDFIELAERMRAEGAKASKRQAEKE